MPSATAYTPSMTPLLALVLAAATLAGRYEASHATLELHVGTDGQLRGSLRDEKGWAALDPIRLANDQLIATARRENDSRSELRGRVHGGNSIN